MVVADVVEGAGVESALGRYHRKPLGALPLEGYPLPVARVPDLAPGRGFQSASIDFDLNVEALKADFDFNA